MSLFKNILATMIILVSSFVYAEGGSETWVKMYRRSGTTQIKQSVMLNIVKLDDKSIIPFLEQILMEDIIAELSNKRSVNEEQAYIELAKLVIRELGDLKAADSAPLVFQVYLNHGDALLQSECITSLGNMRATQYVDDIAYILHTKNQRPLEGTNSSDNIDHENRVAFAAISALDRFKHIDGYSPVFFASIGWYNQRVRHFADKVLLTIIDNPVDALVPILVNGDFKSKEKAITQVDKCKAPAEDKIIAAREGLIQGHDNIPETIREGIVLTSLRKKAMDVTRKNNSNNISDIPYLVKSLKNGVDLEERILAMKALAVNKSDKAIEVLSATLLEYNDRNASGFGINYLEEDVVRELIDTLGTCGSSNAEFVLTSVMFSGYPDGIVRKAKKALKELQ